MGLNLENLNTFIDSIRSLSQTGFNFSTNPYDKSHYEKLMALCETKYAELLDIPESLVKETLRKELGYLTSKVGSNGLCFNDKGELLLEKRKDDHSWCLPGGWVDATDTPEESCIRELKEETGFDVKIKKLLGICSRKAGSFGVPHSSTHIIYECEIVGGELEVSFESIDVAFWKINDVPVWHRDHRDWLRLFNF